MLDLPDQRFFFRRPFSVLSVSNNGRFELLYKVVGQGTRMMADFSPETLVSVLAPLGKTFPLPESIPAGSNVLLLGGGIGIAPLYSWLEEAKPYNHQATCVYGVRSASELAIKSELQAMLTENNRAFATDDGSYQGADAYAGRIDGWIKQNPGKAKQADMALICGPMPMMRACANALKAINPDLTVYVSLENHMPCGTGVCSGCVVFTPNGNLPIKVCLEGPVLESSRIDWDNADGRMSLAPAACSSQAQTSKESISSCQA